MNRWYEALMAFKCVFREEEAGIVLEEDVTLRIVGSRWIGRT